MRETYLIKKNTHGEFTLYCKYGQQVYDFGRFRLQLCLLVVVVFTKKSIQSTCTVVNNRSHFLTAIWAHLLSIYSVSNLILPTFDWYARNR